MNGEPASADPAMAGRFSIAPDPIHHVTQLLADWNQGDGAALEKLAPLVYEELPRPAHRYMQGQRPTGSQRPGPKLALSPASSRLRECYFTQIY
jgi:hypothetical protein